MSDILAEIRNNIEVRFGTIRKLWLIFSIIGLIAPIAFTFIIDILTISQLFVYFFFYGAISWTGYLLLKRIQQLISDEFNQKSEEIDFSDFFYNSPLPQMIVHINEKVRIDRINGLMEKILGLTNKQIEETAINELGIKGFELESDFMRCLFNQQKIENYIVNVKGKNYQVWGQLFSLYDETYALLIFCQLSLIHDMSSQLTSTNIKKNYDFFSIQSISQITHDVVDAMNAIVGFSCLLEYNTIETEKKKKYLNIIQHNARRIIRILTNMGELKKLNESIINVNYSVENINHILDEWANQVKSERSLYFSTTEIIVMKYLEDEESFLMVDRQNLSLLIINLLAYILEFKTEGRLEIGYKLDDSNLQIYVNISNNDLLLPYQRTIASILETEYWQIKHSSEINLMLVKKVAQILHAKINTGLDDNIFSIGIELPLQPIKLLNIPHKKEENYISESILNGKNILIIEDIDYNQMLLNEYLTDSGANLFFASNGKEALHICKVGPPMHLVLIDIQLPDMDGYELMRKIKELCPHAILIAQTALALTDEKNRAIKEGFHYYFAKPLIQKALIATLTRVLQEHLN